MSARGFLVAAPRSGAGKTTVVLGLLAALRRRGIAVRAAKSGPDYIDIAFHEAATGRSGLNLDSWAMPPPLLDDLLRSTSNAELLVVEGAMGLFDGVTAAPGRSGAASDLAARYDLPVLLVLDVSGQAQSAAAILRGFATHDPAVRIAGTILNRVGSVRHRHLVEEAIASLGIPVVGAMPRDESVMLPERHLGLVQAAEHPDLAACFAGLAGLAERHIDLEAVSRLATPLPVCDSTPSSRPLRPPGRRIALARDAAFSFIYAHVLEGWRQAGAEVVPFSPLADEPPPDTCDACWLPGGYPELHGGRLSSAATFLGGLRRFAETRPVHGECGGHMVLGRWIEDAAGTRHAMAGLLGHCSSFAKRRLHLGYREARLLANGALGPGGSVLRGHEFHYATAAEGADPPLAEIKDSEGRELGPAGGQRGFVTGSFFHAMARAGVVV